MECPRCGVEIEATKPKNYWMVRLSVVCFVAFGIACLVFLVVAEYGFGADSFLGRTIATLLFTFLVASPILAIIASLKINHANDSPYDSDYASKVIGATAIVLFVLIGLEGITLNHQIPQVLISGANLNGLGKAMVLYANDNNGQLPEAETWCDLLITNADVPHHQFMCRHSGAKQGESLYALNKEVVGIKRTEIPPDMVVLFETTLGIGKSNKVYKDRWNQVGGPESLALSKKSQVYGCNILFGNWDVKFITLDDLANLKWSLKEDFTFKLPQPDLSPKYSLKSKRIVFSAICIIVISCAFLILYNFQFRKYWLFSTLLGLLSFGVCYFFAFVNELARVGIIAVCVLGFTVGLCYVAVLTKTSCSIKQPKKLKGYAISLGMATGVICSIILQIIFVMIDMEKIHLIIIIGLFCGIIDGAILGAIGGLIIKKYYTIIPKINEIASGGDDEVWGQKVERLNERIPPLRSE